MRWLTLSRVTRAAAVGLLGLLLAFTAWLGSYTALLWRDAAHKIELAQQRGIFVPSDDDTPLSSAEKLIIAAEFAQTWDNKGFPCRTLTQGRPARQTKELKALPGMPVSQQVSTYTVIELGPERTIRFQLLRTLAACQLEQAYSDRTLLRALLARRPVLDDAIGAEAVALRLFGKPMKDLSDFEAAKIEALLHNPRLGRDPARWNKRASATLERLTMSSPDRRSCCGKD